ncbi:MurR/RpiR family transcriptional regulator [Alcaligenes aquatilis]|uniref:MurR/RpiR family transcriptional regulator n=1 Tax=Alcaligenes aquatilis TaxID=323284 RepID=UPI000F672C2F|nr:MurR/RpiR family transcriptional regulator [Alcaligenes aquatilis]QXR34726.1 MurR/RpiR family transcriptional regulator [Alcaligenes aquatilis]
MPDTSNISFLDRVRAILSDLPASERRLAQFTLDFSGDLSSYNASELASLAQVSNATVTRLIRRLEYANYEAARKQIRSERTDDSFTPVNSPLSPGETTLHSHLQESYSKLGNTYRHLSQSALLEASQAISRARQVWLIGLQANYFLAGHFHWHLSKFMPGVRLIPGAGQTVSEYLTDIQHQDVLIIFDLHPRASPMPELIQHLEARCADIVLITDQDYKQRPKTRWSLPCQPGREQLPDNSVAVASLSHLLLSEVLKARGADRRDESAQELAAAEALF